MKVTLYKNCILNNKYKDIFCSRTILESYLNTLDNTVITLDDTFSRESDSLYLDDVSPNFNVLDYNYIKIEDTLITFYAFIRSIKWLSESFIINYEEDIIANHFDKIKVRNGLQIRSRLKKTFNNGVSANIKYFKEPLESEGNNAPIISPVLKQVNTKLYDESGTVTNITAGDYDKVSFLVKLQLYELQTGTDIEVEREPFIFKVCVDAQGWKYNLNINTGTFNAMDYVLNKIVKNQPIYHINGKLYEIDQIFAVPTYLISNSEDVSVTEQSDIIMFDEELSGSIGFIPITNKYGMLYELRSELAYDRKLYAIGLINNSFDIVKNGTSVKANLRLEIYGYTLSIYLFVQNDMYEVTNLFEVDIPYQPITAQALQLRRIQLLIENNDIKTKVKNYNIDKKVANVTEVTGVFKGFTSLGEGVASKNASAISGGVTGIIDNIVKTEGEKAQIKNNISNLNYKSSQINSALYSNAEIIANKVSYKTAMYGLLTYKVDEENTSQITSLQNMTGYVINELVKDNLNDTYKNYLINNNTYDILQFSEVNLYGSIAQNYLSDIEDILLNGVRIWGITTINV